MMQLEDRPDKVYIYNLDQELAEVAPSESESRLVFIPEIERHLSTIPKHVLRGEPAPESEADSDSDLGSKMLVLYREPASLTMPQQFDPVRRAIVEARQRVREKQARLLSTGDDILYPKQQLTAVEDLSTDDPDAMDLS